MHILIELTVFLGVCPSYVTQCPFITESGDASHGAASPPGI
jgi:hypothetical protein